MSRDKWISRRSQEETPDKVQVTLVINQAPTPLVRYKIKAAVTHTSVDLGQWRIHSFPLRVGHHFWVLVKTCYEQEGIIESLHGLSTRYREDEYDNRHPRIPRCVGTWNSILKVYFIPPPPNRGGTTDYFLTPNNKNYWIDPDITYPKYGDDPSEEDALARWNRAKGFQSNLNDAEMPYSFCGVGKSIGFFKCKNSNSVYSTMGAVLGVTPHPFKGYLSPGSKTMMLPPEAMKEVAYPVRRERERGTDNACDKRNPAYIEL